jgi:DNA-binding NarL/FixJ family response regulator
MGGQEEWLTPREAELMPLVCEGMSNQQIAEVLDIREDTVKRHISDVMRKYHAPNRTSAAVRYTKSQNAD